LAIKNYKLILILVIIPLVAIGIVLTIAQKNNTFLIEKSKENNTIQPITKIENSNPNNTLNQGDNVSRLLEIGENLTFNNKTGIYHHTHDPNKMFDDFSSGPYHLNLGDISPNGKWLGKWNGGGSLDVKQDTKNITNYVSVVESGFVQNETRSALVLTNNEYENFKLSLDVRNDKQLREVNPNSWEVGWIFWRYVDNTHFYYFTLKPNGSESGKYDGGVNPIDQLFLESTEFPNSVIGKWDHLDIIVDKSHITILVNGKIIQDFDDVSSFDKGQIGLYCEDASVSFDNITIVPINS